MAYVRGNLAVKPKYKPPVRQRERQPHKKQQAPRKSTLSAKEKLLYLFTIVFCVLIASVLIYRYAIIYETNKNVQTLKRQTEALHAESNVLKVEREKKSDWARIEQFAKDKGLKMSDKPNDIIAPKVTR
ncbi:cell division protein FtsL [Paenibacillus arenosi]|uniref:Cell division protein FtsL n=1 Tax=Paenibacillus arenosi TaxID=2774142 RepID=A0ABR9ARN3_9BACL|nr:cell division protein FtsL [Paenibacillus arenosi]MBD8496758.1 cell division protein FtsL [Paenibacillus arenosi]